jgi:hypothetical protein
MNDREKFIILIIVTVVILAVAAGSFIALIQTWRKILC